MQCIILEWKKVFYEFWLIDKKGYVKVRFKKKGGKSLLTPNYLVPKRVLNTLDELIETLKS